MDSLHADDLGFSEHEIYVARKGYFRDCPDGRCSKRKFLSFIRKSCIQKSNQSTIHIIKTLHNYRHCKKFFSMMFDIYDRNHDGELDFDDYIYALSAITGANRLLTIETLFKFFDSQNQGYITRKEFDSRKKLAAQFLGQYQPGITDTLYEKAFSTMDINKDGYISKEEFIQWHLKDHLTLYNEEQMRKRTHLLRNSATQPSIRGQIKTSSLQRKDRYPIDFWLETTMNTNQKQQLPSTNHVDRHLMKIFYRARLHLHNARIRKYDSQSDSGIFTMSSSTTISTDSEFDVDSFLDINDYNDFQSNLNDDKDEEFLCQSLENALMETILELREKRLNNNHLNTSFEENENVELTRF